MSDRAGAGKLEVPAPTSGVPQALAKLPALRAVTASADHAPPAQEHDGEQPNGFDLGTMDPESIVITGRAPLLSELGRAPMDPQLRPMIGAVDDQFEHEADRIATHALGLPSPPTESSARAPEPPAVPEPQAHEEAPIDEAELTHGGRPLPDHLRTFFEGRLGFDLGHVRVHEGDDAHRLNESVAARAFTYGSHIWLGRGEPLAPTFTFAHELTHVVQQTQPQTMQRRALGHASTSLQRTPYWSAADGRNPHNEVLHKLGKSKKLLVEAPTVGSSNGHTGHSRTVGWADLWHAKPLTAIGIAFDITGGTGPFSPWKSPGTRNTLHDGSRFERNTAAPQWNEGAKKVTKVAQAPSAIQIGDVKPVPWSESYLGGVFHPGWGTVFRSNVKGIQETAGFVDGLVDKGMSSGTKKWGTPSVTHLDVNLVDVPDKWKVSTPLRDKEDLALFEAGKKLPDQPKTKIRGSLKVFTKQSHDGVWHYTFIPDPKLLTKAAKKEPEVDALAKEVKVLKDWIEKPPPISAGPTAPKPRMTAPFRGRPGRMENRVLARRGRDLARELRRQRKPPEKDNFELDGPKGWKSKQSDLKTKKKSLEGKDVWKDAVGQKQAYEAHVALQKVVPSVGPPPTQMKENAEEVSSIEFWLGWKGTFLARLRKAFGRVYIKIAKAFYWIKDKVTTFFAKTKAKLKGDKWWQKVIDIAWRVIKFAAPKLINAVFVTLWDALARGVLEKIKSIFPQDAINQELAEDTKALLQKLGLDKAAEAADDGNVDTIVNKIGEDLGFGEDFKLFEALVEVADMISDFMTIVTYLKWLARIAAAGSQCAWPPGIGCLKILLLPLVEYTAEKIFEEIAETCTFQMYVADAVASIDLFQYFGKKIGVALIERIQAATPELGSFFKVSEVQSLRFRGGEFPCDETLAGGRTIDPDQAQLAQGATAAGEEGIKDLIDAMETVQGTGTGKGKDPSDEEAKKLEDLVNTEPQRGGGIKKGEPVNRPRAPEEEKEGGKEEKAEQDKPKEAAEGKPTPSDTKEGVEGKGPQSDKPKPGPTGESKPGEGKQDPDQPPKPGPGTKEQPGEDGENKPGGKPKYGKGGDPQQPKKTDPNKPTPSDKQGKGQTPMQKRAQEMIERLTKLRDALQKRQQQRQQKEKEEQQKQGQKPGGGAGGKPSGGKPSGGGQPSGGQPSGGQPGGGQPQGKGTPTPTPTPGGQGEPGKKPEEGGGEPGAKPEAGQGKGQPAPEPKPVPGEGEPKPTPKPGEGASEPEGTPEPKGDKGGAKEQGGGLTPGESGEAEPKKEPSKDPAKPPGGTPSGTPAGGQDKGDKKRDRVPDLIDLIDQLIELLKKIRDGEIKTDDDIDSAIAILVANAKNKVRLDPNADRIILVFESLGGTVEEGLGIKRKKDKGDEKDKGDQGSGDAVADAVDNLDGDPADAEPGEPDEKGDPAPKPKVGKGGTPGGKKGDKGDKGPDVEKPGTPPVFDFDPISGGYFVGINEPWRSAGLLVLSPDGTRIINRRKRVVAVVAPTADGQVELVSGSLITLLTQLARDLADKPWTLPGTPKLRMSFYVPNYAQNVPGSAEEGEL